MIDGTDYTIPDSFESTLAADLATSLKNVGEDIRLTLPRAYTFKQQNSNKMNRLDEITFNMCNSIRLVTYQSCLVKG